MTGKIEAALCVWLLAGFALPVHAADVHCPETIPVKQTLLKQFAGWTASMSGLPIRLAGVTFYDGAPDLNASLAPDNETTRNQRRIAVWKFASRSETWLACSYAGTDIVLSRPMPKATTTCRVTYTSNETIAGLPAIEKIECQ